MLKFKHVSVHKRFLNLLVCPGDEEFVVLSGLLGEALREVDGHLEVEPVPEGLE